MNVSKIVEEIFCINYQKNFLKDIMLWLLRIWI